MSFFSSFLRFFSERVDFAEDDDEEDELEEDEDDRGARFLRSRLLSLLRSRSLLLLLNIHVTRVI